MRFRPCIDLREGRVVQIIGSSLIDKNSETLKTNFETDRSPGDFATMYKEDNLPGGHVISLGPGNEEAAHLGFAGVSRRISYRWRDNAPKCYCVS